MNSNIHEYKSTSLEDVKYDHHTEHDLGMEINLIDRDQYDVIYPAASLHADDARLLEDEAPEPSTLSYRSECHAKCVPWLRKSCYISTEQTRFQRNNETPESRVGYNIKKSLLEETVYMDRNTQIKAIENTFLKSKIPLQEHYV